MGVRRPWRPSASPRGRSFRGAKGGAIRDPSAPILFGALLVVLALAWPGRALADGPDAGAAEDAGAGKAGAEAPARELAEAPGAELAEREAREAELKALVGLAKGELPASGTLAELLGADPRDGAALAARALEVEASLAATRAADAPDSDAGTADGEPRVAGFEREVEQARLAALRLPAERLAALADAEAARAERGREGAKLEAASARAGEEAKEAEEARKRALEAADAARSAAERELASATARAEGVRRDQAELRQRLAEERQRAGEARAAWAESDRALLLSAEDAQAGGPVAVAAYDALVEALSAARAELASALDAAEAPADVPRLGEEAALAAGAGFEERRRVFAELAESLRLAEADLEAEVRAARRERLRGAAERGKRLNEARLELLPRLPEDKRDRVLGFGPEGIAQLRRELFHVRLLARHHRLERGGVPGEILGLLRSPFTALRLAVGAFWLGLLAFASLVAVRRGSTLLEGLRRAVVRASRGAPLARPVLGVLGATAALLPELVLLGAVWLIPSALGSAMRLGEVALAHALAYRFALYRLALAAAYHGITYLSHGESAKISPEYRAKILRSLRIAGRYALFVSALLVVSAALLGRGYLHHVVGEFAWVGAIPIGAALVRMWREDIADAYLRHRPTGGFSGAVRASRGRWHGFFVALFAVLLLASVAAGRVVSRTLLGFEQSRKALAYLFRRRLERHADAKEEAPAELPPDLERALGEEAVSGPELAVDHYPGLDAFERLLGEFRGGRALGALLVAGDSGYGKTSWVREAVARAGDLPAATVVLRERVVRGEHLAAALAPHLGAPPEASRSIPALSEWLAAGSSRLVVVDDAQLLYRRGLGNLEAWDAFVELVRRTGRRVFWVCAMARYAAEYLAWARRGTEVFREVVELEPWTEEEIARLLHRRVEAAGYEVRYDDLVVDKLEGVEGEAQLLRTESEYARLIWDYAEGCPRTALRCWRNSLVPDGERAVRVRLFRRPGAEVLERLRPEQRFVLAAVVWHQRLDEDEAAETLRLDRAACAAALETLTDWGVLEREPSGFRLGTAWLQPVRRFLRREHLIED